MTTNVKVIDRGWKNIVAEVNKYRDGSAAVVGIQGSEAEVSHVDYGTNAEIGAVLEFGTRDGKIPSRPFLREPFDANEPKYKQMYIKAAQSVSDGKSPIGELLLMGEAYKADVLRAVKANQYAQWALSTQAQKARKGKSGDPVLWDTGQLMNSITAVVRSMTEIVHD